MEQRRHKRFAVEYMDIRCMMRLSSEARLMDLSLSGASVLSQRRLEVGGCYALRLLDEKYPLEAKGRVVWERAFGSRKDKRGELVPQYKFGLRFDDALTNGGELISDLLQSLPAESNGTDMEKRRLAGLRVKLTEGSAFLDIERACPARNISKSGVLLGACSELEAESLYRMEIFLPEDENPLKLTGRVAYCAPASGMGPEAYDIGVEFLEMNETEGKRLGEFIDMMEGIANGF